MAYLKPQSPLEKEGNYFYPLTTADQVILDDGSRLDEKLGNNNINLLPPVTTSDDGKFLGVVSGEWTATAVPETGVTEEYVHTLLNRTTSCGTGTTDYTTYMARGEALFSSVTIPTINGAIAWTYE